MRIEHNDAIILECIVRGVYSCQRGGMGGYIDADHFESEPFDAALIALAPLWKKGNFCELENFLFKWEHVFRKGNDNNLDPKVFIDELDSLVSNLLNQ